MKKKKLLTVGLAFALTLACVPTFAGCEQAAEDFIILALNGFQKAPEPTVKEGRFHFSVTCEVGGAIKTISSVYVCEFKEAGLWLDGSYVEWHSYIEDSEIATLPPDYNENLIALETNEDGTIYLDLCIQPGYFMAEPSWKDRECVPYIYIKYNEVAAETMGTYGTQDVEVLESYGVKLIGYEYDAPIENTYK